MEPEVRKAPVRYYEIDLLRFLAAMSVVLYHWTYRGYMEGHFSPVAYPEMGSVTKYGWLGVQLFFIISGYVVLMSAQGKTVRQFFLSRVTRLYPAYWAGATLTFLAVHFLGPHSGQVGWSALLDISAHEYLVNLTMLQEFVGVQMLDTSYWSLTIEIGFYFLVSLLIGCNLFRGLPFLLLLWLVYVAATGPDPTVKSAFFILFFPKHAPFFVAGMVFYLLQNNLFAKWQLYALLGFSFLLGLRSVRLDIMLCKQLFHDPAFSFSIAAVALSAFYLVFWLLITRRFTLPYQWLKWVGALTYPLYLLHAHIGFVAFQRVGAGIDKYLLLALLLTLMLGLAYTIHVLIEKRWSKPLGQAINSLLQHLTSPVLKP